MSIVAVDQVRNQKDAAINKQFLDMFVFDWLVGPPCTAVRTKPPALSSDTPSTLIR